MSSLCKDHYQQSVPILSMILLLVLVRNNLLVHHRVYILNSYLPLLTGIHHIEDEDTNAIIDTLRHYKSTSIALSVTQEIHIGYCQHHKTEHNVLLGDKLILFKYVNMNIKFISLTLTIVPTFIQCKLLYHYHGGPSIIHLGEYQTLYRICMWFFESVLR